MTRVIDLELNVEKPFGNLFRKRCVLIAVFNDKSELLLGEKPEFYPPTIARLVGGGVEDNEDPRDAAQRELQEEMAVTILSENFQEIAVFHTKATDTDGEKYENTTHILSVSIGAKEYHAGDDIKSIKKYSLQDLRKLIINYENLPKTLWYKGSEGEFSWHDYAQLYGTIHDEVASYWQTHTMTHTIFRKKSR